jgi:hypothetical protein
MNPKALFLILIIALAADAVTGFSSTVAQPGFTDAQTFQSGAFQCTLVQNPPTQDTAGCTGSITFPTAFASVPTKYGISTQCMSNTPQTFTTQSATTVCSNLGIQVGHVFTSVLSYILFESDNGQTWTNMPVAATEIYGTMNHEQIANLVGIQEGIFSVNIITTSTSAGNATLRPQYFDTNLGTWHDLMPLGGFVSVNLFTGPTITGRQSIPLAAETTATALRIVGQNGGGIGDVPVFNEITLEVSASIPLSIVPSVGNQNGNPVTTTVMPVWVTAINPGNGFGGLNPIFSWWACVC